MMFLEAASFERANQKGNLLFSPIDIFKLFCVVVVLLLLLLKWLT